VNGEEKARALRDEDIILQVRRGDINAYEAIVKRYESSVANIIYGILGSVSNAEDLGQEVFIRAYRGLGQFRFRAQFRTYLTRIAINVCKDALKKNKVKTVPIQEQVLISDQLVTDGQEEQELKDLVQKALLRLERDQRMVIVLRILEGYSTRDTAGLLKVPQGTVLSRLSRGMERLRQILEKDETMKPFITGNSL